MIGRTNSLPIGGGGTSAIDAYIAVTYPVGSVCTCTNGSKTLRASDTNGLIVFSIPSAGSWTVTASKTNQTASKTITVAANNLYEVTLNYRLPTDIYQAVRYIGSTLNGNQDISTNITPGGSFSTLVTRIKFSPVVLSGTTYRCIFAYEYGTSGTAHDSELYFKDGSAEFGHTSTNVVNQILTGTPVAGQVYETTQTVNGSTGEVTYTGTPSGTISADSAFANGSWKNGSLEFFVRAGVHSPIQIYECTVTKDGTLIADLIPCYRKSDSAAGLWEHVSETFYTNTGSGTFTVGEDIEL